MGRVVASSVLDGDTIVTSTLCGSAGVREAIECITTIARCADFSTVGGTGSSFGWDTAVAGTGVD